MDNNMLLPLLFTGILPKQDVEGSNPFTRSPLVDNCYRSNALKDINRKVSLVEGMPLTKIVDFYKSTLISERKSKCTIEAYGYNLQLFIKSVGDIPISEVTRFHIRDFEADRATKASAYTQHQAHRVLRTFFNWAVKENFIQTTPMVNIKAPKLPRKVWDVYSKEEITNMLSLCSDREFRGVRNRAMISTLLDTGVRQNELCSIRVEDIDYKNGVMIVWHGKGDVERTVRLGDKALHAVKRYILFRDAYLAKKPAPAGHENILFLSEERKGLTGKGLATTIQKIGKSAGIKRTGIHKFRHTFAILYLRNGGDIVTLKNILGHTNINTTMRYLTALSTDDVINAHAKFSPGDKFL